MDRRQFLMGAGAAGATLAALAAMKATGAELPAKKYYRALPKKYKPYRWEELNVGEFEQAVKDCEGVCLLPLSCLEKHGRHLPLGTDYYIATEVCERAAMMEKAMVFPPCPFGLVSECKHVKGTIGLKCDTLLKMLREVCEEISRNGFKKILLVNGHGGNQPLIHYFVRTFLEEEHDYTVYYAGTMGWHGDDEHRFAREMLGREELPECGHAGVLETSEIMACKPETCKMEVANGPEGHRKSRLEQFKSEGLSVSLDWYADYPTHQMGDPAGSSKAAGEWLLDMHATNQANAIRLMKQDKVTPQLLRSYWDGVKEPILGFDD